MLLTGAQDCVQPSQRVQRLSKAFSSDLVYAVSCGKNKPQKHTSSRISPIQTHIVRIGQLRRQSRPLTRPLGGDWSTADLGHAHSPRPHSYYSASTYQHRSAEVSIITSSMVPALAFSCSDCMSLPLQLYTTVCLPTALASVCLHSRRKR